MAKEDNKPQQKPSADALQKEIRKRAEEISKTRTDYSGSGDILSDWLQAEAEIKKKYGL